MEDLLGPREPEELSILIELIELIDIHYNSPRKSEMFLRDYSKFITNPKNIKSKALRMKY